MVEPDLVNEDQDLNDGEPNAYNITEVEKQLLQDLFYAPVTDLSDEIKDQTFQVL